MSQNDVRLASFGTWDFFAGLSGLDGGWDVRVWVKSAFDKTARISVGDYGVTVANIGILGQAAPTLPPVITTGYRVVGVNKPQMVGISGTLGW